MQDSGAIHYVPQANWHTALADAIEQSQDGDTIIVHNPSMKELAERALGRMCPGKLIFFQIRGPRFNMIDSLKSKEE